MTHPWKHPRLGWMRLEAPDQMVGIPVHCREVDQMAFKGPFQFKQFYDSMIISLQTAGTLWFVL